MNTHQDTIAVTGNETLEELEALLESMEAEESRPTVEKEQGADEHLALFTIAKRGRFRRRYRCSLANCRA